MTFSMKLSIEAFNRSFLMFKNTSDELDIEVQSEVIKMNTVEELQELVDSLPKSYIGCRRIYEKIERLSEFDKPQSSAIFNI